MATDPFSFFNRNWPTRIMGINQMSTNLPTNKIPAYLGYTNQAQIIVGTTGANGFILTAGGDVRGLAGANMTLTVATGAGSLGVVSNGLDITVTLASAGSHASAIVTAINAQFPAAFCVAALYPGGAGGSNVSALSKTYLTSNQRTP